MHCIMSNVFSKDVCDMVINVCCKDYVRDRVANAFCKGCVQNNVTMYSVRIKPNIRVLLVSIGLNIFIFNRLDSLVVERPLRVREVAGSNPGRVIPKT